MKIACIGSRSISSVNKLLFLEAIGAALVRAGHEVHSGGAVGADQKYAIGAAFALGMGAPGGLVIHLPWDDYEVGPTQHAVHLSRDRAIVDAKPITTKEIEFSIGPGHNGKPRHPRPDRLEKDDRLLMGRNARILFPSGLDYPPVDLVIALPSSTTGGTRHGMRLAEEFHIRLHDLSQSAVRARYEARLTEMAGEKGRVSNALPQ